MERRGDRARKLRQTFSFFDSKGGVFLKREKYLERRGNFKEGGGRLLERKELKIPTNPN